MQAQSEPECWHPTQEQNCNEQPSELELGDGVDRICDIPFDDANNSHNDAALPSLNEGPSHSPSIQETGDQLSGHTQVATSNITSSSARVHTSLDGPPSIPTSLPTMETLATPYRWAPPPLENVTVGSYNQTSLGTQGHAASHPRGQAENGSAGCTTVPWKAQSALTQALPPILSLSIFQTTSSQALNSWAGQSQLGDPLSNLALGSPFTHPNLTTIQNGYHSPSSYAARTWSVNSGYQSSAISDTHAEQYPLSTSLPSLNKRSRQLLKDTTKNRPHMKVSTPSSIYRHASSSNSYTSYPAFQLYQANHSGDGMPWSNVGNVASADLPSTPFTMTNSADPFVSFSGSSSSALVLTAIATQPAPEGESSTSQNPQDNTPQPGHRALSKQELHSMDPDPKYCDNCRTTNTPSWRRCPRGRILLCNACGL